MHCDYLCNKMVGAAINEREGHRAVQNYKESVWDVLFGPHCCIARAECDGTRAETRFRLSPKRTSPFKSVGASVQSTAGGRGVRISLSNAG